ncbi:MAG: D-tagatose-bisphosphate aldolase, class II, non-catalytic subunit [Alphaproteobacteria bacterium]
MTENKVYSRLKNHKKTGKAGIVSICSAHPLVLEAAAELAQTYNDILLIESTSNQVDQFGGYTGLKPKDFVRNVKNIIQKTGFDETSLVFGGDHLGPNAWQKLAASEAMENAKELIALYIKAGYTKIHLDCSMSCKDDADILSDEIVAKRAATLCKIAEDTLKECNYNHRVIYIIGTEVPTPGGALEELDELQPTSQQAALKTYQIHKDIFAQAGLSDIWENVVALVVQPGVEFDHHNIVDYEPAKAKELIAALDDMEHFVYEAHSTDYQKNQAFKDLIHDHFAILKVGPALTFALREALFILDNIEQEIYGSHAKGKLQETIDKVMIENPKYWQSYYEGSKDEQKFARKYSFSDRIRYYWNDTQVQESVNNLFDNLSQSQIPLSLLKQFMPMAYEEVRQNRLKNEPECLTKYYIKQALIPYFEAASPLEK